jgi:hypothetical protein
MDEGEAHQLSEVFLVLNEHKQRAALAFHDGDKARADFETSQGMLFGMMELINQVALLRGDLAMALPMLEPRDA